MLQLSHDESNGFEAFACGAARELTISVGDSQTMYLFSAADRLSEGATTILWFQNGLSALAFARKFAAEASVGAALLLLLFCRGLLDFIVSCSAS